MKKFWTEEEDQFLEDNYPNMTNSDLREYLDRTEAAIYSRLEYIGITKRPPPVNSRTQQTILKKHLAGMSYKAIANEHGMNTGQVGRIIRKLKAKTNVKNKKKHS